MQGPLLTLDLRGTGRVLICPEQMWEKLPTAFAGRGVQQTPGLLGTPPSVRELRKEKKK